MSKALEAYRRLCRHLDYDNDDYMFNGGYEEDNEIIENALKDYEILKKYLDRLEKLEKFIILIKTKRCCLNEISPSSWNDRKVYEEMCNYDYYLFELEANYYSSKNKERMLTEEEFNLIKDVLEK